MSSHLDQVIRYYEETDWDHRYVWHKGMYQAAHFGIYDDQARDHKAALMNTTRIMCELAQVVEGTQVMDAGCGWGGTSLWLSKYVNARVTGVNITSYQVDECQQKARKLQVDNRCKFLLSDYCDTPFEDASFDVVWSCESLCHAADKLRFYQEAYRVLRPGGRLIIADYLRVSRPVEDEVLLHNWLDGWACVDIDTKDEHLTHASHAGFGEVNYYDYSDQVQVSLRNLYIHARRWHWIGVLGDRLRLLKPFRLRNVKGTVAMYQAFLSGLWRYHLIHCVK